MAKKMKKEEEASEIQEKRDNLEVYHHNKSTINLLTAKIKCVEGRKSEEVRTTDDAVAS